MEFLQTWQQKQHGDSIDHLPFSAKGLDVVVIGGGDTGCDCIGTSLRQVSTVQVYRCTVLVCTGSQEHHHL